MGLEVAGRRVLLSGGAGAIGQVVVATLARHGMSVVVNDVVPENQARPVLPSQVGYVPGDCADEAAAEAILDAAEALAGGPLDSVCCHAGVVDAHPVTEFPTQSYDRIMAANVRAAFLLAGAAGRRWRANGRRGHLIFTTSWVQDVPWPEIAPYSASKAALRSLMRSFARELAPYGIRANAIAPGIVGVGMARHQWDTDPSYRTRAQRAIPLGELQKPESVADAFLFLLSPMASYMTGSVLLVDGGASLYPMDDGSIADPDRE
jgi:NAD(P)-dependent dehydrogenase (short-subunit alcohol dehydrogenase family)